MIDTSRRIGPEMFELIDSKVEVLTGRVPELS